MSTAFTLAEVKTAAALVGTQYDAAIPGWVAALEHQIEQYTGLTLTGRTETVRVGGNWREVVLVPGRPVSDVLEVRLWDEDIDVFGFGSDPNALNFMGQNPTYAGITPAPLARGVDYGLNYDKTWAGRRYSLCGEVVRNAKAWPGRIQKKVGRLQPMRIPAESNVEIVYSYGFVSPADIPPPFLTAVAAGLRAFILRIPTGGIVTTSQSLDGASVSGQVTGDRGEPNQGGIAVPDMGSFLSLLAPYCVPKVY